MKERITYTCECCRAEYEEESLCLACESIHAKPERIVHAQWDSYTDTFPTELEVEMNDGTKITYVVD